MPSSRIPSSAFPRCCAAWCRQANWAARRAAASTTTERKAEPMSDIEQLDLAELEFEHVEKTQDDGDEIITLNHPDALNALSSERMLEFSLVLDLSGCQ